MKANPIKIGIDVGGTNTDAVLMRGSSILAIHKSPTTSDISSGIKSALESVLQKSQCMATDIEVVIIGTTHFMNALLERKHLAKVAAIRLCLPAASDLPPFSGWDEDLANSLGKIGFLVAGGLEYDGTPIAPINHDEILKVADALIENNIKNVAITGIFSQMNPRIEQQASEILLSKIPDLKISLSHNIGRIGLLERENATILNAALLDLSQTVVTAYAKSIRDTGISAPFYLTQNDGTLMKQSHAKKYPILTCAAGCTNSMRGAAFLANCKNGIVIDIGGTSSDIGVLVEGFPKVASSWVDLGGIRTNFPIPATISLALGGGTIIRESDQGDILIGPDSVGHNIVTEALIFGGKQLTMTDIAVANKQAHLGNTTAVNHLNHNLIEKVIQKIHLMISNCIDRIKSRDNLLPLILAGGGAILISKQNKCIANYQLIRPQYAEVANAVGAAIALVSGTYDQIVSYEKISRDLALETAAAKATIFAIENAAIPESVYISEVEEIPLTYLSGKMTRLRVKVVGDLNLTQEHVA